MQVSENETSLQAFTSLRPFKPLCLRIPPYSGDAVCGRRGRRCPRGVMRLRTCTNDPSAINLAESRLHQDSQQPMTSVLDPSCAVSPNVPKRQAQRSAAAAQQAMFKPSVLDFDFDSGLFVPDAFVREG
jgi:hypothetical protein